MSGMQRSRLSLRAFRRVLLSADSGLSLIELVVAMVIFAIIASGVIAGLAASMKTARLDKNRVAATNLAARELEITRNEFKSSSAAPGALATANYVVNPHALPGQTSGAALKVDGIPYTVTRDVEWLPAGSGKSTCDGGSSITYPEMAVNVSVTWPSMGSVKPVTANTILTPPKGVLSSTLSFVGVKVLASDGLASQGRQVTLTGPGGTLTDTTAEDGCAVFAVSTAGTYTASMNTPGYVDFYGDQTPDKTVVVTAGTLSQVTINYDKAATLTVSYTTQSGYSLPTGWPTLTLANTGLQPTGTRQVSVTSATTTVNSLWPFIDGYGLWAGSCNQSDPAAAGGTRDPNFVLAPGASGSTTTNLAPVALTVKNTLGVAQANAVVTATPISTTGCVTTENPLALGTTNSSGVLNTSLPAGKWTIKVTSKSPSGSWPITATLLPTSSPSTIPVVTL